MSGGTNMMQQQQPAAAPATVANDDFGDFEGAASPSKGVQSSDPIASDPMSRLISLNGLTKKSDKKENQIDAPVIVNDAAAQFVQNQQTLQASGNANATNKANAAMSFKGI